MRHGAQRDQSELHGKQHVAGAGQLPLGTSAQAGGQGAKHFLVPVLAETPARTVVGNLEVGQAPDLQLPDLGFQPLATFDKVGLLLRVAEIDLVDDGQHRDLEQDGVQPRALDQHLDLARRQGLDADMLFIEPENRQEIDKVALDEAHGLEVGQLRILELQAAQPADFLAYLVHVERQVAHAGRAGVAALELVFHLGSGELVQHHLHHGELVQVGVEQAGDDHVEPWSGMRGAGRWSALALLVNAGLWLPQAIRFRESPLRTARWRLAESRRPRRARRSRVPTE